MPGKPKATEKEYNPAWGGPGRGGGPKFKRFTLEVGKAVVVETSLGRFLGEVKSVARDGKSVFIELVGTGSVTIEK